MVVAGEVFDRAKCESDPGADGRSDVLSHPKARRKSRARQGNQSERKVRTPQGGILAEARERQVQAARVKARRRKVPQKTDRPPGNRRARVKRWVKSPPRLPRGRRQGKPGSVQGKIGDRAARPSIAGMSHLRGPFRAQARGAGIRGPAGREAGVERNDRQPAECYVEYIIRLTAPGSDF